MRHKKKLILIVLILVVIEFNSLFLMYKSFNNKNIIKENISNNLNTFAIMLEDDSGNYILSNNISWPTDEYRYNSLKSGCVDDDNNEIRDALYFDGEKAYVEGDTSIYCYLYFDKKENAYAIYSETDNSLTFIVSKIPPVEGQSYKTKIITKVFNDFEDNVYYSAGSVPWFSLASSIKKVVVEDTFSPTSTTRWFADFINCSYFDVEKLDTSKVTNMWYMFYKAGYNVNMIEFMGLEDWNVENVRNTSMMFYQAGYSATEFDIGDLSNWNTKNVKDMGSMFRTSGFNATKWYVGTLSNWDTSSVEVMEYMFADSGYNSEKYELDLSDWDVRNVTDMEGMFYNTAYKSDEFSIGNISEWKTGNVTTMYAMFNYAGYKANYILDLSRWDVSKVTIYTGFNTGATGKISAPKFGAIS